MNAWWRPARATRRAFPTRPSRRPARASVPMLRRSGRKADIVAKVGRRRWNEVAWCARPDPHLVPLPRAERKPSGRPARQGATVLAWTWCRASAAPEDGALSSDGQHRGLPRGDRGRQPVRPLLHRPDHGRRQGATAKCWCSAPASRVLPRSARRSRSARRCAPSTCGPRSPSRFSRWAPSSFFSTSPDAADGAATGGYAAPSSPEFRAKQLELFRAQAPEVDIVITTALIRAEKRPSSGWRTWSR